MITSDQTTWLLDVCDYTELCVGRMSDDLDTIMVSEPIRRGGVNLLYSGYCYSGDVIALRLHTNLRVIHVQVYVITTSEWRQRQSDDNVRVSTKRQSDDTMTLFNVELFAGMYVVYYTILFYMI